MERIQHLKMVFHRMANDEEIVRTQLNQGILMQDAPSLDGSNLVSALYAIYINKDIPKAKQHFYNAARIAEFMHDKFDWRVLDVGIHKIGLALLSDDSTLIERYAVMDKNVNYDNTLGFQIANAVQNILLDNKNGLNDNIDKIRRFLALPRFKLQLPVLDILEGFKAKDELQIYKGLKNFLKDHAKRSTDPLIPKFISLDTCGFCKLAWRCGYKIDLESEFVPIELMPVKPLDHYEFYDFIR